MNKEIEVVGYADSVSFESQAGTDYYLMTMFNDDKTDYIFVYFTDDKRLYELESIYKGDKVSVTGNFIRISNGTPVLYDGEIINVTHTIPEDYGRAEMAPDIDNTEVQSEFTQKDINDMTRPNSMTIDEFYNAIGVMSNQSPQLNKVFAVRGTLVKVDEPYSDTFPYSFYITNYGKSKKVFVSLNDGWKNAVRIFDNYSPVLVCGYFDEVFADTLMKL